MFDDTRNNISNYYSPKIDSHRVSGSQTAGHGAGALRFLHPCGTPPHSSTTIALAIK